MKNGERIVLEAAEGITFRVQEGKNEIVIKAILDKEMSSIKSDNYEKPYIPEGYVHLKGEWQNGFVIQNQADKSEFVWVPVGWLDEEAILDGKNFKEKFGRVNWNDSDFSQSGYHEEVNQDFIESVKKYGGFYFARYHASKENGKLVFKKGNMPWCNINYHDAANVAAYYAYGSKDVVSQITSGAAFDSVLRWIIKSQAKTIHEVLKDSNGSENYLNSINFPQKLMPTGSEQRWRVCNIYDIAGNVDEWTSEQCGNSSRVLRGGGCNGSDDSWPAYSRIHIDPNFNSIFTSFRNVLYIK